jgi:hypothetical protein
VTARRGVAQATSPQKDSGLPSAAVSEASRRQQLRRPAAVERAADALADGQGGALSASDRGDEQRKGTENRQQERRWPPEVLVSVRPDGSNDHRNLIGAGAPLL